MTVTLITTMKARVAIISVLMIILVSSLIIPFGFISSTQAQSDDSIEKMAEEGVKKFFELGEERYLEDCKKKGIPDSLCKLFAKGFKKGVESGKYNLTSSPAKQNYETYYDSSNRFVIDYPSKWKVDKGLNKLEVYEGTRNFEVLIQEHTYLSTIDSIEFGDTLYEIYDERDGIKMVKSLTSLNIDEKPASTFGYSDGIYQTQVVSMIHNNLGYEFKYSTLKDNFENDSDLMKYLFNSIKFKN
jgi:hypothetical protein